LAYTLVLFKTEKDTNTLDHLPDQHLSQWDREENSVHVKVRWLDQISMLVSPGYLCTNSQDVEEA
jgi:hypothetical protein